MLGEITGAPLPEREKAEKEIRLFKEAVEKYETEANEQEAKLNQDLFLI